MKASKKFSLLANAQDDSLSRNRFLYDLSDAVDMPYASDSRFVDFYSNGYYWGSYQICEKIETGSDSLVNDFEEEDYLNEDGTVKKDFPFLCELDIGADGEDYFISLPYGIKVTIKSPELYEDDPSYDAVKDYVQEKFNNFYSACESKSEDLSKYSDVDSLAKIYLINELGKNWDAGVSSLFFTYKQDESGNYKFYGSPVWDYDNSLGNAVGIKEALEYFGIDDYENPSGWWCKKIDIYEELETSPNIMNRFAQNEFLLERAKEIWKEKFIPALNHFTGKAFDENIDKHLYTADNYYNILKDSAHMNYTSGWPLHTGNWIADHSSLNKANYDNDTNTYYINKNSTPYAENFTGTFNYCRDWFISRAAWLSKEMSYAEVNEVEVDYEQETLPAETEPITEEPTEAETQPSEPVETTLPVEPITKPAAPNPTETETAKPNETEAPIPTKSATPAPEASIHKLNKTAVSLKAGKTYTLKVIGSSVNHWNSSNTKSVKVKNGKVTALTKGSALITANLKDGSKLRCKVTVTSNPTIKINNKKFISSKTYYVERRKSLKIKLKGKALSVKNKYKSSKNKIAGITSKRSAKTIKIKGFKNGKATVTLTVNGRKFKIKIKVK